MGLDDDDLRELEISLLSNPLQGDVIPGTGGARKMRFAPASTGMGKRGGLRVCYALIPEFATVVMVTAYTKRKKGDLTEAEKVAFRHYLQTTKAILFRGAR